MANSTKLILAVSSGPLRVPTKAKRRVPLKFFVVLKGAYTAIANQGKIYFNTTGNAGLATAGSGDVLTGIITGLIAQNYAPLKAAILGVYLHGRSADIALEFDQTMETLTASDCICYFNKVFKEL